MQSIHVPVYIMHGYLDEVIAIYHGRELHAACSEAAQYPPYFIEAAGHDDVMEVDPEQYLKRLSAFIQHVHQTGQTSAASEPLLS